MKIDETKYMKHHDVFSVVAWGGDFVYALEERPWICKLLFKLAIGRFAWREFVGMVEELIKFGSFIPRNIGYSYRGMEYHKERPELWGLK